MSAWDILGSIAFLAIAFAGFMVWCELAFGDAFRDLERRRREQDEDSASAGLERKR